MPSSVFTAACKNGKMAQESFHCVRRHNVAQNSPNFVIKVILAHGVLESAGFIVDNLLEVVKT